MAPNAGKTVAQILRLKRAIFLGAALPRGSPSWDDIMRLTWEDVEKKMNRRERGFKTFHKLLSNKEYDK